MVLKTEEHFIKQLGDVLLSRDELRKKSQHDDLSDLKEWELQRLSTMALAAIERVSGSSSVYTRQAKASMSANIYFSGQVLMVIGVLESLKSDLQSGYLRTIQEIIHADVFTDFIEMSNHLLDEGYKDAAAVIGGSSLESHLRQLCNKNGISTTISTTSGTKPKKADQMNSELSSVNVYSKLDQKNVTSWLDLRNKAAHGNYSEYTKDQVDLFLKSIQDFITRNPA